MRAWLLSLPAQVAEFSNDEEDQTQPRKEGDQAHGAPYIGIGGRKISRHRLVGEVVGIGVILSRATRRCCPGRPGKVSGQVFQLTGVMDIVGGQAGSRILPGEVVAPLAKFCVVGHDLAW